MFINEKRPKYSRSIIGPTSTYEKQPFEKGININSKAMPSLPEAN
jgi:hypothetical protein